MARYGGFKVGGHDSVLPIFSGRNTGVVGERKVTSEGQSKLEKRKLRERGLGLRAAETW